MSSIPTSTPVYITKNGLRFVKPYNFPYKASVKQRWFGRTVFDVYTSEFRDKPANNYLLNILNGNFTLRKNPNSLKNHVDYFGSCLLHDVRITKNDKIFHIDHIHEPPVPSLSSSSMVLHNNTNKIPNDEGFTIPVIYQDDDIIVVNKPPGIPSLPVNQYRFNTVIEILKIERGFKQLFPVHRLDKLTSGVLIFGKSLEAAVRFKQLIKVAGTVEKTYVAKVKGHFEITSGSKCSYSCFNVGDIIKNKDGSITLDQHVIHIYAALKQVRNLPAASKFKLLSYDPFKDESLVECKPITGKTHQLRIHLRNLGFPIINDPLYGPNKIYSRIITHRDQLSLNEWDTYLNGLFSLAQKLKLQKKVRDDGESSKCDVCKIQLFKDPVPEDLFICLHSRSYQLTVPEKEKTYLFEAELPDWYH
ncbi:unnamed protein product [Ambrosiozyma monospora]|uniref:Unnamed protein product n=1 Tax=Ambrosiozyma monospora TaxID=43982 RepID=A0A9W6YZI8_AMBMO|nr:unnamed protein product [Ambrosiozyma monospora]